MEARVRTGSGASQRSLGGAATFAAEWVVEPGYEAVRDAFLAGSGSFGRGGGAYCAYVHGKPVVDVWAGQARPGQPWRKETAAILMSATKGFTAICGQILVDRGRIDLDEPVATYWPEYAQNGKQDTLVRQLLAHTAGVIGFDRMHEVVRHDGVGWGDLDRIAPRLAEDAPSYPPGTQHCYHAPDDRLAPGGTGSSCRRPHARPLLRRRGRRSTRPRSLDRDAGRRTAAGGARPRHAPRPSSSAVPQGPGERTGRGTRSGHTGRPGLRR